MFEPRGILNTFTLLVLFGGLLFSLAAIALSLLRSTRHRMADLFFAGLHLCLALMLLHKIFIIQGFYIANPEWLYLPIYFTLSIGPLLFFSMKLWVYPAYRLRFSDLKHALLPVGQFLYFFYVFFQPVEFKRNLIRDFFSPFNGGLEMILFVGTFYAYLYAAYRYILHKRFTLCHHPNTTEWRVVQFLAGVLKVLVVLFWMNSAYIAADFLAYELFGFNLHHIKGFTRFGDLLFASMPYWLGWCTLLAYLRKI